VSAARRETAPAGETMLTRAAVLDEVGGSLSVEQLELAPPGPGEVRVRIEASGVCHSDWNVVTGNSATPLPAVLGHEGAATVLEAGAGVTALAPGDQVVLSWLPACGRCRPCQEGRLALCEVALARMGDGTLPSGASRLRRRDGTPINHYSYLSTFAEHAVVAETCCIRLEPGTDLEVAALVGCAVMTGVGAVVNRARVPAGASVAVIGAGGVGLSAIMAARLVGAARIVALEPVETKRALALELGATDALDGSHPEVLEQLRELTAGGPDFVIEAAGVNSLVELAVAAVRPGGMVVGVGLPAGGSTAAIGWPDVVRSEKVLTGTFYGSARPRLDMPMILALHAEGRLPLDRLVTERYTLDEVNTAFDDMISGRVARGVIIPAR
jgi:Zn-dependent alcohol dehydrogenase